MACWVTSSATYSSMTTSHRTSCFIRQICLPHVPDVSLAHVRLVLTARRDRSAQKDAAKNVKHTAAYVPLRTALAHRWSSMTRRQTKELNPAVPFAVLGA